MTAINRDKHDTPDLNRSYWTRRVCMPPCTHARVCGHHGTQIFLASCLLLARWSSNTAGTEMLSWGLTQASKAKVKLGFKDSSLNFPLTQSHSLHCFHNSNMCFRQAICSCFHIQTFYIGYILLRGRDTGFGQLRLQLLYMMHLSTWWSLPYSLCATLRLPKHSENFNRT